MYKFKHLQYFATLVSIKVNQTLFLSFTVNSSGGACVRTHIYTGPCVRQRLTERLRYEKKPRIDTEPRVHLLWAAVLQQGLNQDVQIFFRGLLSELLLTRQMEEETGGNGRIKRYSKREREREGEIIRNDETAACWRTGEIAQQAKAPETAWLSPPRNGSFL